MGGGASAARKQKDCRPPPPRSRCRPPCPDRNVFADRRYELSGGPLDVSTFSSVKGLIFLNQIPAS